MLMFFAILSLATIVSSIVLPNVVAEDTVSLASALSSMVLPKIFTVVMLSSTVAESDNDLMFVT